jgi:hypothetical protein
MLTISNIKRSLSAASQVMGWSMNIEGEIFQEKARNLEKLPFLGTSDQ